MSREVVVFEFPKELADTAENPVSVGLVRLKASEELMALRRARGDAPRAQYELVQQAMVQWNGNAVSLGDGSVDKIFESVDPRVRTLILQAYTSISNPTNLEVAGFLTSSKQVVSE